MSALSVNSPPDTSSPTSSPTSLSSSSSLTEFQNLSLTDSGTVDPDGQDDDLDDDGWTTVRTRKKCRQWQHHNHRDEQQNNNSSSNSGSGSGIMSGGGGSRLSGYECQTRLVAIGPPGSGKTTLLKTVAYLCNQPHDNSDAPANAAAIVTDAYTDQDSHNGSQHLYHAAVASLCQRQANQRYVHALVAFGKCHHDADSRAKLVGVVPHTDTLVWVEMHHPDDDAWHRQQQQPQQQQQQQQQRQHNHSHSSSARPRGRIDALIRLCRQRIQARGQCHQTLTAGGKGFEQAMRFFQRSFVYRSEQEGRRRPQQLQQPSDGGGGGSDSAESGHADRTRTIHVDVTQSRRQQVAHVMTQLAADGLLREVCGADGGELVLTSDAIDAAIDIVRAAELQLRHAGGSKRQR